MAKIVDKIKINDFTYKFEVLDEEITNYAKPGQFVMVRTDENSERIPLTIENIRDNKISLLIQIVGTSTHKLCKMEVGDSYLDFYGPFGRPIELESYANKNVLILGIGRGISTIPPLARPLREDFGAKVDVLSCFESKSLVIYEDELAAVSDNHYILTLDGTYGYKGHSYEFLGSLLEKNAYDLVITIGPASIVERLNQVCMDYKTKSIVCFNSIMVCGAGICGSCRLTVDGSTKFACVDGPFFDGSEINYEEVVKRLSMYTDKERDSYLYTLAEERNVQI